METKPSASPGESRRTFRPTAANAAFKSTPRFKTVAAPVGGRPSNGARCTRCTQADRACQAPCPGTGGRPSR